MKIKHVNDQDIQQFAFDLVACKIEVAKHIQSCKTCKMRVEEYQLLSNTIKNQPEPVVEFNLAELVLNQLPLTIKEQPIYSYFVYFLIALSIGLVTSSLYYFKEFFLELFSNITTIFIYLIISITALISFVQSLDILRSFNKKINILNHQ
ncbi:hypothetical protein OAT18_01275 [Tenacibaculum sp.]|nr:hypothetical protein [Tenacibaculum sp.]